MIARVGATRKVYYDGKSYEHGTFERIGRELSVSGKAVALVAEGRSTSARIRQALDREYRKQQRTAPDHGTAA